MATVDIQSGQANEHDIAAGRLPAEKITENFSDLHPPLSNHEALVEADRCYFCHDAPCTVACPTSIDIPLFIRQIAAGNDEGAGITILEQNIMGGMCARVCPVETLCEEACVRNLAEDKPVRIGLLQRHATDYVMKKGGHPFIRAEPTRRRVAVVGAGPAGLSCAHRLATHGHEVTLLEATDKPGGLNEYGIAAYKTVDNFAAREAAFILGIGGIEVRSGQSLGRNVSLAELRAQFDAVFLGIGLAGVNSLSIDGEDAIGSEDAVRWIAALRQSEDPATIAVGRRVVVIGGGMTAIDAGVQSKLLGADQVTIVYRRGQARMNASTYEQQVAQTRNVGIRTNLQPVSVLTDSADRVTGVEFERTLETDGRLTGSGEREVIPADMVMKAIGQALIPTALGGPGDALALRKGRIIVDDDRRTNLADVWAGGDCVAGGEDLTVVAVEDGKVAAESIHRTLAG